MAGGYVMKNVLLNGAAVSCTASLTQPISNTISISDEDSLRILAKVRVSAMVITNAIAFRLQESMDGTNWDEVGSESSVSGISKVVAGGVAEVTDITWPATAGATQGDYVHVTAADGTKYAVWLDIDANGTVPTGALYTAADQKIKVSIVTGGTAAANAALARAAVVANAAWVADFTTSSVTVATFTITQILGGVVADPAPKSENDSGAGSITVSVTTAGTDGGVAISTNRLTSTSHGFVEGEEVIYTAHTVAIGGLTTLTNYWIIKIDANVFKLATSYDNALAGTAVDITTAGTGTTHTFCKAVYEIRMLADDATDAGQLPLLPCARVVAVTGASDTCTVSSVLVSRRV